MTKECTIKKYTPSSIYIFDTIYHPKPNSPCTLCRADHFKKGNSTLSLIRTSPSQNITRISYLGKISTFSRFFFIGERPLYPLNDNDLNVLREFHFIHNSLSALRSNRHGTRYQPVDDLQDNSTKPRYLRFIFYLCILTFCRQRLLLVASSCRNCFHELKLSSREPLLIFLKAMAVSVVVTFQPSITLACLNHLSDWVSVIWLPSEPDSPNLEKTSN